MFEYLRRIETHTYSYEKEEWALTWGVLAVGGGAGCVAEGRRPVVARGQQLRRVHQRRASSAHVQLCGVEDGDGAVAGGVGSGCRGLVGIVELHCVVEAAAYGAARVMMLLGRARCAPVLRVVLVQLVDVEVDGVDVDGVHAHGLVARR